MSKLIPKHQNASAPLQTATESKYKYIGGGKEEVRLEALKRAPELMQAISTLSNAYNIPPQLVAYRLGHEGLLDGMVYHNNEYKKNQDLSNTWITPFSHLGLDDAFTTIRTGRTKLKRHIPLMSETVFNEKGRATRTIIPTSYNNTPNYNKDLLEIFVAELAARYHRIKEKGYQGDSLLRATNRAYNAGEYSTIPLTNYGIGVYKDIIFPKPLDYSDEFKGSDYIAENVDDAIKYLEKHIYKSKVQESVNTKDPGISIEYDYESRSPYRSKNLLKPWDLNEVELEDNAQKHIQYKKERIIKNNTNIRIKPKGEGGMYRKQ